jgi:cell wall-associated NlpC family hydrolase
MLRALRMPSFFRLKPFALLLVLLLSAQAHGAPAQPQPTAPNGGGDALLRLITEKGWVSLDAANQGVRRARDAASDLVIAALNFLDRGYRRGGSSAEEGFDCSGFVRYVYRTSAGLVLPRRSDEQARAQSVTPIALEELRPGDLVFFNTLRRTFSHVGIYIGDGRFIHSPRSGASVRIEDMRKDYWATRFDGARRVSSLGLADASATAYPASPR